SISTNLFSGTGRLEKVSVSGAGSPYTGPSTVEIWGAPSGPRCPLWTPTLPHVHGRPRFAAAPPKSSVVCWRTSPKTGAVDELLVVPVTHRPSLLVPSANVSLAKPSGPLTDPPPFPFPPEPWSKSTWALMPPTGCGLVEPAV